MKKKMALVLTTIALSMCLITSCGTSSTNNVPESTKTVTKAPTTPETTVEPTEASMPESVEAPTPKSTEAPHEHVYTEEVVTALTCETNGVIKYTCECGDTYTDEQATTGHIFETYTANNDATYTADGTETAKCNNCDVIDTRTAEGSMLTYTYTDMDATMYAQKTVNVRSMPNTDGEKLGSLSTNDEVKVTGQCAETSWYRIEFDGNAAYVNNSYLGNNMVVVETEAPANRTSTANTNFNSYAEARAYAISLGYPIGQAVDNGNGTAYCYCIGHPDSPIYGEDSALHSADIDSARRCADEIFGFGTNYWSVTENGGTHVERFGNGWTVYRFTYTPTYAKIPTSTLTNFPYELYTLYDNGTYFYFYTLENDGINKPDYWYDIIHECEMANAHRFATYDEWGAVRPASEWADSGYMLKGEKVMIEARFSTKEQLQNRGLWTE